MACLEDIVEKIAEYSAKYRHPTLEPICMSELYSLQELGDQQYGWPATWPHNSRRGVYAIFSSGVLLYIGKASQQPIGNRLSSYFRYGPKRECITNPNHFWSVAPTHVISWAVPDDAPFEASALEEYLIREFSSELPDNSLGKRV